MLNCGKSPQLLEVCMHIVECVYITPLPDMRCCGCSQSGGPFWAVPLGRKDGTTASDPNGALAQLPSPIEPFENITSKFTSKGLTLKDLVVLSGLLPIIISILIP